MASLHIRLYEFAEAAEAYENAAKTAEKARFSPGRIREYYLRAFFCWMMGKDTAAAGALLESSGSSSAAFGRSREHGFAVKYLRAFVEVDYLKVLDVVDECMTSLNLNPWFNVAFRRLENDLQKTLTETGGDSAAAAVAAENDAAVKEVCGDDDDDDNNDNANENDDDEDFKLTPSSSSKGIHPPKHSDDSDDDGDDLC